MFRTRTLKISLLAAGSIAAVNPSIAAAAERCDGTRAAAASRTMSSAREAILCLVNRERAERGLPALRTDGDLQQAAQAHSDDMVERRYFAHDSPGGASVRDRVTRAGYLRGVRRWSLGENIGWASRSLATPAGMVQAWMESPGHKDIILTRTFREAGVGIAMGVPTGRGSGATFTMDFGLAAR